MLACRSMYTTAMTLRRTPRRVSQGLVLNELRQLGPGDVIIERKVIEELCRWERPHPDAPDQDAGLAPDSRT
jgi:hypothetical protein